LALRISAPPEQLLWRQSVPTCNRTRRRTAIIAFRNDLSLLLRRPAAAPTGTSEHFRSRRLLRFNQKLSVRHVSNRFRPGQTIAGLLKKLKMRSKGRFLTIDPE
jgi:hypothetical protein